MTIEGDNIVLLNLSTSIDVDDSRLLRHATEVLIITIGAEGLFPCSENEVRLKMRFRHGSSRAHGLNLKQRRRSMSANNKARYYAYGVVGI